jgi:transcriptional regulator with XRE-family HTH domain
MAQVSTALQFAEKLRERRQQVKMDQATLAGAAGVPVETIESWEAGGATNLTLLELGQLADVLDTSIGELAPTAADDLDNGVRIQQPADQSVIQGVRDGMDYYTYHCLVRSRTVPSMVPLVVDVLVDDPDKARLNGGHAGHEFLYVLDGELDIKWGEPGDIRTAVLRTGASLYIKPYVSHSFTASKGTGSARLLAVNF